MKKRDINFHKIALIYGKFFNLCSQFFQTLIVFRFAIYSNTGPINQTDCKLPQRMFFDNDLYKFKTKEKHLCIMLGNLQETSDCDNKKRYNEKQPERKLV